MSKFQRPGAKPASAPAPKAPAAPTSKYKKSREVQVGVEGNYQRPGRYLLLIQRIEEGQNRTKEQFVSVRSVVLVSDGSERTPLEVKFGGSVHRVGEEVSWFQKLAGDFFDQNMLKFAIAASNMTQDEIAEREDETGSTIVDDMVSAEQPLAGVAVEAHVQTRIKKAGKDAMKGGLKEEDLKAEHVTTVTNWVRRLPYAEVKELVPADVLEAYLPDIDEKIAEENTPAE